MLSIALLLKFSIPRTIIATIITTLSHLLVLDNLVTKTAISAHNKTRKCNKISHPILLFYKNTDQIILLSFILLYLIFLFNPSNTTSRDKFTNIAYVF